MKRRKYVKLLSENCAKSFQAPSHLSLLVPGRSFDTIFHLASSLVNVMISTFYREFRFSSTVSLFILSWLIRSLPINKKGIFPFRDAITRSDFLLWYFPFALVACLRQISYKILIKSSFIVPNDRTQDYVFINSPSFRAEHQQIDDDSDSPWISPTTSFLVSTLFWLHSPMFSFLFSADESSILNYDEGNALWHIIQINRHSACMWVSEYCNNTCYEISAASESFRHHHLSWRGLTS